MADEQTKTLTEEHYQLEKLRNIQKINIEMTLAPNLDSLLDIIAACVMDLIRYQRILIFLVDDANRLIPAYLNALPGETLSSFPPNTAVTVPEDSVLWEQWTTGNPVLLAKDQPTDHANIGDLLNVANFDSAYSLPLIAQNCIVAMLFIERASADLLSDFDKEILETFAAQSAACIYNQNRHEQTVQQLADKMRKITMLAQLDREINETITLQMAFTMTLDWALRFTNAHYASISLYDLATDTLQTMINYGYTIKDDDLQKMRDQAKSTITRQVARSGAVHAIADLSAESTSFWAIDGVQSQLAVPIIRENRVVGVMTLESRNIHNFTKERIAFAQQLANRAASAIDNARLYDETVLEREKLAHIVGNIGDAVMVIDADGRIAVMSQSARSALQQHIGPEYLHKKFKTAVTYDPLISVYRRVIQVQEVQDCEITFPNKRDYYVRAIPDSNVGCIITMQDITPYKETDRLKNELIATVSHDLKQPLGIMKGYIELLGMKNEFDEDSLKYVDRLNRAITRMRQLIDDLLDLARIESGVKLDLKPVPVASLLWWCIENNRTMAEQKAIVLETDFPEGQHFIRGEKSRLEQVFNNLVGNAIKYTPEKGHIKITFEDRDKAFRIAIKDNGLGIAPEDQPHVFDRFYRVRRPETTQIEGTGLGLAIVKALIDAHKGQIRLESHLDKGSTFYVTLPAF